MRLWVYTFVIFLFFPLLAMEQLCDDESDALLQVLKIPITAHEDSDPFNDINNFDPIVPRYQLRNKRKLLELAQPKDEIQHEIILRIPQKIDRGMLPEIRAELYSDGEETGNYPCIRSRCAHLVFHYKQDLKAHYTQKHKLRDFHKCPICKKKSYNTKSHLQQHIIEKHSDKKPDICPICNKELHALGSLNRHLKEIHNLIPPLLVPSLQQK